MKAQIIYSMQQIKENKGKSQSDFNDPPLWGYG